MLTAEGRTALFDGQVFMPAASWASVRSVSREPLCVALLAKAIEQAAIRSTAGPSGRDRDKREDCCPLSVGEGPFGRRGEGSALSPLDRESRPPIGTTRFGLNYAPNSRAL